MVLRKAWVAFNTVVGKPRLGKRFELGLAKVLYFKVYQDTPKEAKIMGFPHNGYRHQSSLKDS